MPDKPQTMPNPCRGCWWQEGGRCYNEHFAVITTEPSRLGESVSTDLTLRCRRYPEQGYWSKREALTTVIPSGKLVIVSESNSKQEAPGYA